jgi:hypothetical protein
MKQFGVHLIQFCLTFHSWVCSFFSLTVVVRSFHSLALAVQVLLQVLWGLLLRASPSRREVASFETMLDGRREVLKSMLSGFLNWWCGAPT